LASCCVFELGIVDKVHHILLQEGEVRLVCGRASDDFGHRKEVGLNPSCRRFQQRRSEQTHCGRKGRQIFVKSPRLIIVVIGFSLGFLRPLAVPLVLLAWNVSLSPKSRREGHHDIMTAVTLEHR